MHDNDNTHELKVLMLDTATGFYRMRRYRVGDFFFFHVGITGEGDHFQPVQQGPGNQIDGVGRGDEHDVGEIERRVQRIKDKGKERKTADQTEKRLISIAYTPYVRPWIRELSFQRVGPVYPLRTGIVEAMGELERCPRCGHAAFMGKRGQRWQAVDGVPKWFGKAKGLARKAHREFVETMYARSFVKHANLGCPAPLIRGKARGQDVCIHYCFVFFS